MRMFSGKSLRKMRELPGDPAPTPAPGGLDRKESVFDCPAIKKVTLPGPTSWDSLNGCKSQNRDLRGAARVDSD
jgi:hypothetical protein